MGHPFRITEIRFDGVRTSHGVSSGDTVPQRFEWTTESHAVPRDEIEWGVEQRTSREDYGDEPVEHLHGSSFDGPISFNGVWDDRFMGAGKALDTLFALEAMVARGTVVRVEFGRLQWVGVLLKVRPRYQRDSRIGYELILSPHGREPGRPLNKERRSVRVQARRSPTEFATDAGARAADLGIVQDDAPRNAMAGTHLVDMTQLALEAQMAAERARTATEALAGVDANRQAEANLRAAYAFGSMRTASVAIIDRSTDVDLFGTWSWGSALGQLQVAAWAGETTLAAYEMAFQADEAYRELCRRGVPKSRAPYEVAKRESLYAISYRFYGTTERANEIGAANNLAGLVAEAGAKLIIPDLG